MNNILMSSKYLDKYIQTTPTKHIYTIYTYLLTYIINQLINNLIKIYKYIYINPNT